MPDIELRDLEGDGGAICRSILDELPAWFGIGEANDHYVEMAGTHPNVVAALDGKDVGITTVLHHSPYAAEIYLMAMRPAQHRSGAGTAMLHHVESTLAARGVEFLQVKTLSAARPDVAGSTSLPGR